MKVGEAASWGGPARMVLPARAFMHIKYYTRISLGASRNVLSRRETGGKRGGGRAGTDGAARGERRKGALEGEKKMELVMGGIGRKDEGNGWKNK